jgi:hypothetical protein
MNKFLCENCGKPIEDHCKIHAIPCCPGKCVAQVGDIQVDKNSLEWIVVGVTHTGVSRVRRNSLAHKVHAKRSPEIAKTLI